MKKAEALHNFFASVFTVMFSSHTAQVADNKVRDREDEYSLQKIRFKTI